MACPMVHRHMDKYFKYFRYGLHRAVLHHRLGIEKVAAICAPMYGLENSRRAAEIHVMDDMVALGTLLDKLSPGQLADVEIQDMMAHLIEDISETVGRAIEESGDRDLAIPYGGFVQAFEQALGEEVEIKDERLLDTLQEVLG